MWKQQGASLNKIGFNFCSMHILHIIHIYIYTFMPMLLKHDSTRVRPNPTHNEPKARGSGVPCHSGRRGRTLRSLEMAPEPVVEASGQDGVAEEEPEGTGEGSLSHGKPKYHLWPTCFFSDPEGGHVSVRRSKFNTRVARPVMGKLGGRFLFAFCPLQAGLQTQPCTSQSPDESHTFWGNKGNEGTEWGGIMLR